MASPTWHSADYKTGLDYLDYNEVDSGSSPVADTGGNVILIVPLGLPVCGARFHGLFMMAPILIFLITVLIFPFLGFSTSWEINLTTLLISLGCLGMAGGLLFALKLLTKNRDLFPRIYFVTLGEKGIAMNFSRRHFPLRDPKAHLAWTEVGAAETTERFFLPALLIGRFKIPAILVHSKDRRTTVEIPFLLPREEITAGKNQIVTLIQEKAQL